MDPRPQESTAAARVWHDGPPPHVGWWNASTEKRPNFWRWWNGVRWSMKSIAGDNPQYAGINARFPDSYNYQVSMFWCDYWPEDGRVERRDPATGQLTGGISL